MLWNLNIVGIIKKNQMENFNTNDVSLWNKSFVGKNMKASTLTSFSVPFNEQGNVIIIIIIEDIVVEFSIFFCHFTSSNIHAICNTDRMFFYI